ncbi:conserved hypothetical protein [Ricinus communis]|uniref:Uncharacterized protein n=1 Tax=Ricinus communis TaxID=3988 RepID=B9S835_RICCO|nr:conserved hypothetical protein [Ricinus communis]
MFDCKGEPVMEFVVGNEVGQENVMHVDIENVGVDSQPNEAVVEEHDSDSDDLNYQPVQVSDIDDEMDNEDFSLEDY